MTKLRVCKNPKCNNKTNNPKFCSQSCSAHVSNLGRNRYGTGNTQQCPRCGGHKTYESKQCQSCRTKQMWNDALNRPISNMFNKGNARVKYAQIRKWARKLMNKAGRLKQCEFCDFNLIVEVNHIRSIGDFPPETSMRVVNAQENMVALCPNHHAMFEKGLLELSSN